MSQRAVIPVVNADDALPSSSALPFNLLGRLLTRPDNELAAVVPCAIWPTASRVTPAGLQYDHDGECPIEYADVITGANVVLEAEGVQYMVVDAEPNFFLPHVVLKLRRMRPAGA